MHTRTPTHAHTHTAVWPLRFSESIKYQLGLGRAKLSLRLQQGLEEACGKHLIGPWAFVCVRACVRVYVGLSVSLTTTSAVDQLHSDWPCVCLCVWEKVFMQDKHINSIDVLPIDVPLPTHTCTQTTSVYFIWCQAQIRCINYVWTQWDRFLTICLKILFSQRSTINDNIYMYMYYRS